MPTTVGQSLHIVCPSSTKKQNETMAVLLGLNETLRRSREISIDSMGQTDQRCRPVLRLHED